MIGEHVRYFYAIWKHLISNNSLNIPGPVMCKFWLEVSGHMVHKKLWQEKFCHISLLKGVIECIKINFLKACFLITF